MKSLKTFPKGGVHPGDFKDLTNKEPIRNAAIKDSFINKIRKQFYNFSKRGEVTLIVCESTKEARKVQRTINKHKHSLHTRRITFTKHDF